MSGDQGEAAVLTVSCVEEDDNYDRCGAPAEFILWGKLLPPEAFGPRCYDHAVKHTAAWMPSRADQWAVGDLREIAALTADNDRLRDRLDAIEAACDDADRRGQMLGSQAVRRLVRGTP